MNKFITLISLVLLTAGCTELKSNLEQARAEHRYMNSCVEVCKPYGLIFYKTSIESGCVCNMAEKQVSLKEPKGE